MEELMGSIDAYNAAPREKLAAMERDIWTRYGREGTALILDMSGFSLTVRRHGLVFYMAKIRRMHQITRPIVEAGGGEVVKYEADNMYARFDRPSQAIDAAVKIMDAVSADTPEGDPRRIRVSIGIAHGRMLFLPGRDYFGDCVNVAAKLGEDLAEADEILIERSVVEHDASPHLDTAELYEATISGLGIPVLRIRRAAAPPA
jgi:class 3 adenylate cyclase